MFKILSRILLFLSVLTLSESFASLFWLGDLNLTPNKFLTAFLLVLAVLKIVIEPRRMPRQTKSPWLIAFGVAGVISLTTSFVLGVHIRAIIIGATTFYALILFYFILVYLVEDETDLQLVLWAFALGTAMTGVTAIFGLGRVDPGSRWERSAGVGGNPNLLAANANLGFAVSVLLVVSARRLMSKGFAGLFAALNLFALMQTASRAGFVAFLGMGGFLIVRSGRLDLLRYAIPGALAAGAAFYYMAPEGYFLRIATTQEEATDLAEGQGGDRVVGWYWAAQAFLSNPITGVGRLTFSQWAYERERSLGPTVSPHSAFLEVAATMGLVGFAPWIMAVILTYRDLSRARWLARRFRRRRDPMLARMADRALYLQGAWVAWLLSALLHPLGFEKGCWFMFALSSIVLVLSRQRAEEVAAQPEPDVASDVITSPFLAAGGALPPRSIPR